MKKILIVLVAIAAGITANAATVRWNSGAVKAPGVDGVKGTANATPTQMYVFAIDAATYNSLASMSYADASASIWGTYGGDSLPTTPNATVTSAMGAGYVQTVGDASGMNYAATIFTYTDASDNQWYIANIGKANVTGSGQVSVSNLASTYGGTAGGTIGSWTAAVPEPTSGLLMLIGLAGLALKRKRA